MFSLRWRSLFLLLIQLIFKRNQLQMGISNCKKQKSPEEAFVVFPTFDDGDVTLAKLYPPANQPKSFYELYSNDQIRQKVIDSQYLSGLTNKSPVKQKKPKLLNPSMSLVLISQSNELFKQKKQVLDTIYSQNNFLNFSQESLPEFNSEHGDFIISEEKIKLGLTILQPVRLRANSHQPKSILKSRERHNYAHQRQSIHRVKQGKNGRKVRFSVPVQGRDKHSTAATKPQQSPANALISYKYRVKSKK